MLAAELGLMFEKGRWIYDAEFQLSPKAGEGTLLFGIGGKRRSQPVLAILVFGYRLPAPWPCEGGKRAGPAVYR